MRRAFKWLGIFVGAAVILATAGIGVAFGVSAHRLDVIWHVQPATVPIPSDAASVAEGKRLYFARGCASCHGDDLAGKVFMNDPAMGQWTGVNLTTIASTYSDIDWVRTIRYGVKPDGKSVFFMPADELWHLSDRDLGDIVAFIKTVPRVQRPEVVQKIGPVARVVHALGLLALDPARKVDFAAPRPPDAKPAPTAEFGQQLVSLQCTGCHGEHLSGGAIPGTPPSIPVPKNLTADATGLAAWTQPQFVTALRTGRRPDGSSINEFMPWQTFSHLSDDELAAMWLYLRTIPPSTFGRR